MGEATPSTPSLTPVTYVPSENNRGTFHLPPDMATPNAQGGNGESPPTKAFFWLSSRGSQGEADREKQGTPKRKREVLFRTSTNISDKSIDSAAARRLRVAMHIQLQSSGELPPEFAGTALGKLCPVFKRDLERNFRCAHAEELRKSSHSKLIVLVAMAYLLVAIGTDLFIHAASGDLSAKHFEELGFLLLVCLWCLLFFAEPFGKNAGHHRAIGLMNLAGFIATYGVFMECIGSSHTRDRTLADVMSSCVRILGMFIGWGSLPATMSMKWVLFVMHLAVILWSYALVEGTKESESLPWYQYVGYILSFYGPILLLFLSFRKRSFEQRMSYLNDNIKQHISKYDQKKIDRLSREVQSVRIALESEERARHSLLDSKAKLNLLRADLEDPEMRRKIQRTHESLIRGYVQLAMSFMDNTEDQIADLIKRLDILRNTSERESLRLANIMEQFYDNFASIPEWQPIQFCPTFELWNRDKDYPKEKLCQTSCPQWWRIVMQDAIPASANQLGLEKVKLEWYLRRAQWAKTPFVHLLKEAVRTFNEASSASKLGLDPYTVIDMWNNAHPDNKLTGLPFPMDASLESDELQMSEMMQGEYLEHGSHAGLQVGPIKDRTRAHAKVEEYRSEGMEKYPDQGCLEKYVCDWLRARVVFANPTALAIFFWYLLYRIPRMNVVASKNKLLNPPRKDTSCNIHLNVRFKVHGEEHTAEVQLLLENFLIAKDLEHKYYEFRRANHLTEILAPVLEVPEAEVKAQLEAEEDATGRQSMSSSPCSPPVVTFARGFTQEQELQERKPEKGHKVAQKYESCPSRMESTDCENPLVPDADPQQDSQVTWSDYHMSQVQSRSCRSPALALPIRKAGEDEQDRPERHSVSQPTNEEACVSFNHISTL